MKSPLPNAPLPKEAATPPRPPAPARKRSLYSRSAAAFRWLHIYVSMASFGALVFFAFTGITLNHPTWFGAGEQTVKDLQGEFPPEEVGAGLDKLAIAESLRSRHSLRGAVSEFEVDEHECMLVFKGPGYAADVFVDRESGAYSVTETTSGMMAVLNDLHKGRDTGTAWSRVIDISAAVMLLMGLSGFGLLLYLKKRRLGGVVTAFVASVLILAAWVFFVP